MQMIRNPPKAPEVYRLLAAVRNAAADQAILRALPHLERDYQRMALDVLLRRRRLGALGGLISEFANHPEGLQGEILSRASALEPALRAALRHEDHARRLHAIRLIAKCGDCRLAYLLNGAWTHSCPRTRELAAKALLTFVERHLARRANVTNHASALRVQHESRHLAPVLGRALRCWDLHTRPEVLTAATWLVELVVQDITVQLAQPRSRLAHALNALLSSRPDPRYAAYVLRALTIPPLRARAARIIGLCQDDAFMTALIGECWLLNDPNVRKACSAIRDLKWVSRSIDPLLRLGKEKSAAAMRFAAASGLSNDAKVGLFRDMIRCGDAYLCRAALWQLIAIDTDAATDALRTAAARADSPVAAMARHELHRRKPETPTPRAPTSPTGDAAPAPNIMPPSADQELDNFFRAVALLEEDQRRSALMNPMVKTPAATRCLRAKLASSDADERTAALQILHSSDLIDELEAQVYQLANDPEPAIRSNAVSLLARLANPVSVRILRRALQDPDVRVQANAIEALDALEVDEYDKWIESKLTAPSSRVRANAIKALLKCEVRRAADSLLEMLDSDARGERLSALWVVERLGLASLVEHIQGLAHDDADVEVRRRAAGIARTLGPLGTEFAAISHADTVEGRAES